MANFITNNISLPSFGEEDPCGFVEARNTQPTNIPTGFEAIRQSVKNFEIANDRLNVSVDKRFQAIPLDINLVKKFLDENQGDDFNGFRIYFSKLTPDPEITDDYKVMLVPCTWNGKTYVDKTPANNDVYIPIALCRRPPTCPEGAIFINDSDE